jgi:alginate O-acetyltransferase complex protein AlgI
LGYDFTRNFNIPYISRNITEFWRRWHISLTSWLTDYVFMPLSIKWRSLGNHGLHLAILVTFLVSGLWHGAGWTFVLWGALQGIALCVHDIYVKQLKKRKRLIHKILLPPTSIAVLRYLGANSLTLLFVCFGFVIFRANNFSTALHIILGVLTWQDGIIQPYVWTFIAFAVMSIASITAVVKHRRNDGKGQINGFYPLLNLSKFWHLVLFFVVIGLIVGVAYTGANPFIYFQF